MLAKKNPVLEGFHPDPCILRVENDYYLATSTFQWFDGVELYHSRDLVNWDRLPCPLRSTSQFDMQGNTNSGIRLLYSDGVLDSSNLSDESYVLIGHEGHTGTFMGMACQDLTGEKAYADFRSFEYKEKTKRKNYGKLDLASW